MFIYNHPANDLQLLDRRLIEIFGEEQCLKWKKESPGFLDYQSYELINGHFITTSDNCSDVSIEMEELESLDPVNFPVDEILQEKTSFINPNRYNIKRSFLARKHYKIGSTNYVLVLMSGEELRRKFQAA
ncbi:MAG TPA: hypothetical protein VK177_00770 [Flavobacteriales bacterium]|nr:hypothetical protein [Flavobacteriales bacterium]